VSRNREALELAGQLESLLDQLSANVAALSAILDPAEEASE